ncbi:MULTISPECIES: succinate dehydrogenase cytochrome B subunit, b558 family [Leptospira]|uniref:Succinate dehydrogenase cytochrome B subunit, b558 family n=4 Tax=Leptospira santarosai TaxID=28183 RepID=M6VA83_9LEPT|nr:MULTISPECIES: succinate dehydrogenase cytochrome B subunit, b558 family [Leptospira]EMO56603.1 succinate dehydrogenase cytochrome B subunit, b558 family [Leptospira santarosai str. CBC1416]EKO32307.1 succinate dehydrogenase cytochrome B subunit, b558 family [Leptospira santarosai str. MOR084]EKO78648.1 succinate dehydrogenase cytochrome B subunit, b558 family [Leptospira sp. Fiocruz LV3954]EKR91517.1 succinate dehydrogenase cytochrome B subunit, b558 family [Leptospira santarosai str. CBC379
MDFKAGYLRSSIGRKTLVAATGLVYFGFVVVHMLGNLQIFLGQEKINAYGQSLRDIAPLLWVARIILIVSFIIHVFYAIKLSIENKQARPIPYVKKNTVQASLASRTMALTGLLIFSFIVYHLLHFTLGVTNPDHFAMTDAKGRHDIYTMVVLGFQNPIVSGSYIFAMFLLASHISHGVQSVFQTLGLSAPSLSDKIKAGAISFALIIFIGNTSIPLSILLGYVHP